MSGSSIRVMAHRGMKSFRFFIETADDSASVSIRFRHKNRVHVGWRRSTCTSKWMRRNARRLDSCGMGEQGCSTLYTLSDELMLFFAFHAWKCLNLWGATRIRGCPMTTIDLASCLAAIPDRRRAEGKIYNQVGVILFSIIAMLSGARSYRQIHALIQARLGVLNAAFPDAALRRAPAYTSVRGILRQIDPNELEQAFRRHAESLDSCGAAAPSRFIAIDGKTLRQSFDAFADRKAARYAAMKSARRERLAPELLHHQRGADRRICWHHRGQSVPAETRAGQSCAL